MEGITAVSKKDWTDNCPWPWETYGLIEEQWNLGDCTHDMLVINTYNGKPARLKTRFGDLPCIAALAPVREQLDKEPLQVGDSYPGYEAATDVWNFSIYVETELFSLPTDAPKRDSVTLSIIDWYEAFLSEEQVGVFRSEWADLVLSDLGDYYGT